MHKLLGLGLAGALLLASPSIASQSSFDGKWSGEGVSHHADCKGFDFTVAVSDHVAEGIANHDGGEYRIVGQVTDGGRFTGEVEFLFITIAELTGDIVQNQGEGAWRTVEGPACTGSFSVRRL